MGAERPQASGSQAHGPVDESNHPFLGDARTTGGFRERSAMSHLSKASGCDMTKRRCGTLVSPTPTAYKAICFHLTPAVPTCY